MATSIKKHHKILVSLAVIMVSGAAITNFYYHALAQSGSSVCGNTICEYPETNASCPSDCPPMNNGYCGNEICESGEDYESCPLDCSQNANNPVCGNGLCEAAYEDEESCPIDCGGYTPPQNWVCGDSRCDEAEGETAAICPEDCETFFCGDGTCNFSEGETSAICPEDCQAAEVCGDGACVGSETEYTCPDDCKTKPPEPKCGDLVCEYPETIVTCPEDCTENKCGNGECGPGETAENCPNDCSVSKCGNALCEAGETYEVCPADCEKPYTGYCGDKLCAVDYGEDSISCFMDCHCGNQTCDKAYGETIDNCPNDCKENVENPPEEGFCVDSDGGRNSAVKGTVEDTSALRTDHCIDIAGVREFYCDANNMPASVELPCGVGYACEDGACVKTTSTEPLYCGDGVCSTGEDVASCPADCKAADNTWVCGDGLCEVDLGETTALCPADCEVPPKCGDGLCNGIETVTSCRIDCYEASCGDGLCEAGFNETASTCLVDCHCGDRFCDSSYKETAATCAVDCAGLCGNKVCDSTQGETSENCLEDCPRETTVKAEDPCVDSDGGKLPRIVGTTERGLVSYRDSCPDSFKVKEYFCNYGKIESVTMSCVDGRVCRDGRCMYVTATGDETQVVKPPTQACGDGRCDTTVGETKETCKLDCTTQVPEITTEVEVQIPPECLKAGITSLDLCKNYLLRSDDALPEASRCGDGFCSIVIGESWMSCAVDCPKPEEPQAMVVDLDLRCVEEGIMSVEVCRDMLRNQEVNSSLPEVCISNGIGSADKCEQFISGLSTRLVTVTQKDLVTSPVDSVRIKVDPRCYEVNILDVTKCSVYLQKIVDAKEEAAATGVEPVVVKAIVPSICSENGILEKDGCETYLKRLYVAPECQAAGVQDEEACRALLAAKRMPPICVQNKVFDEVACLKLQRSNYLPPICETAGQSTRQGCMQTIFEKYGRPDRCAELSDEACWRLVETGKVNEQDFDLKTSASTVPETCVNAGAVTGDECRKLVNSMSVPEECRLNGYYAKSACDKYIFEKKTDVSEKLPSECQAASITDEATCGEYLAELHLPVECAAAGLSSEGECSRYLTAKSMPEDCRAVGITSITECERQLRTKVAEPVCQKAGINDSRACAEYMYRLVADQVKCSGLTAEECAMTIKDKKLGVVVNAEGQLEKMKAGVGEIVDGNGTIDLDKVDADESAAAESMRTKLPLSGKNNRKFKAIASEGGLIITDDNEVRIKAPIVLAIDSDGDGVPDDMEKRYGFNPNSPQTTAGVPDAEAFSNIKDKSGIEKAIAEGRSLGQPIIEGALDSVMRVTRVDTIYDEQKATGDPASEGATGLLMQGQGRPGEVVTLYVYSDLPLVVTTTVDDNGQWTYTFDDSLNDGMHEVYVAVNDDTGKVSRKSEPLGFVVSAAEALGVKEALAAENAGEIDLTVLPEVNVESTSRASTSLRWFIIGGVVLLLAAVGFVIALVSGRRNG